MVVKRIVQFFSRVWASPRILVYRVSSLIWGRDRAFLAASEGIGRIPGMRGVFVRQAFYLHSLPSCGRDIYIGWNSVFSKTATSLGENIYIGRRCGIGLAEIGDRVMLADGVQILSGGRQHGQSPTPDQSHIDQPQEYRLVIVGAGAWLGTNAVIMADVGEGAIIGAGAVVTDPIPSWTVAVGVPAKVIRELHRGESDDLSGPSTG